MTHLLHHLSCIRFIIILFGSPILSLDVEATLEGQISLHPGAGPSIGAIRAPLSASVILGRNAPQEADQLVEEPFVVAQQRAITQTPLLLEPRASRPQNTSREGTTHTGVRGEKIHSPASHEATDGSWVERKMPPPMRSNNLVQAVISSAKGLISTHTNPTSPHRIGRKKTGLKQLHRTQTAGFELLGGFDDQWIHHVQKEEDVRRPSPNGGFLIVTEPTMDVNETWYSSPDYIRYMKLAGGIIVGTFAVLFALGYACIVGSKASEFGNFTPDSGRCSQCVGESDCKRASIESNERFVYDVTWSGQQL